MKILTIGNTDLQDHLGAGKTRLRWKAGLTALGHSIESLEPKDYMRARNFSRGRNIRMAVGALRIISKTWSKDKYDLVEFCGGEMGLAMRYLWRKSERPKIVHHSDGLELLAFYDGKFPKETGSPKGIRKYGHNFAYMSMIFADALLVLSSSDAQYALGRQLFTPDDCFVCAPGMDDVFVRRQFNHSESDDVAYLGSWTDRKNPGVIVRVMSEVLRQRPETQFKIFGASSARDLIRQSFPADISGRVHVFPRLSANEMADRLAECSIFFFPSIYEGFGMATAEAMLCSLVPVTSPTGYGSDLLKDNIGVVRSESDVDGYVESIIDLIDKPSERKARAQSAHAYAQSLTWSSQAVELERIYLNLLMRKSVS